MYPIKRKYVIYFYKLKSLERNRVDMGKREKKYSENEMISDISYYEIEPLQKANLSNNFLFVKVMSDPEILRSFLEIVLKIKIRKLKLIEYEKTLLPDMYARGIRMDIYADDGKNGGEGTLYNVEMQQRDEYNISKRSRYYQSAMDMDALAKGTEYEELKNTYVIFVCMFDPFGKNHQKYTFKKFCMEENALCLDDGSVTMILTDSPGEPEIEEFYRYLKNSTDEVAESSKSEFVKRLNHQVQKVRYDRNTEVEYLNFERLQKEQFNRGLSIGEARGEVRGKARGEKLERKNIVMHMSEKGRSPEEISELTDIGIDEIYEILNMDKK